MKILITGGTGLIGRSTVDRLLADGHTVRLLSRHASADAERGIDAWPASVTDAPALQGAASACDVVLHIAGIADETPPDTTFQRVNVDGTRNILAEAQRAGVRRFVYVSSLGAPHGKSAYHASKRAAEALVRDFGGEWIIARPGNVYGPGDGVLSRLVRFVRALPVVPVVDDGDQPFQPIWHEDVGAALALICTAAPPRTAYEVAGPDVTTLHGLFDLLGELTAREPRRVSLSARLVQLAARFAGDAGVDIGITPATLQMLLDGNFVRPDSANALDTLRLRGTPLRKGLEQLLRELPEQPLDEGFGKPQHRRVRAVIACARVDAASMFERFVEQWQQILPVETNAEPVGDTVMQEGAVLTLALPLRGNIAVRVVECYNNAVTLATLEGHPLSGFVRFTFAGAAERLVFEINVYDRAATAVDAVGMLLGGSIAQGRVWREAASRAVAASGGTLVDDVEHELDDLNEDEVAKIQEWFDRLTLHRRNRDQPA